MSKKVLFITDPMKELKPEKDTSIFMMEEAISLGYKVYQAEIKHLYLDNTFVMADARNIIEIGSSKVEGIRKEAIKVSEFSYTFMRKDPPVDTNYLNALHLLGLAEIQGATIFNKPNAIKEFNEKVFATHFKEFIPRTLITSCIEKIIKFQANHEIIIVKPLDGMGGDSIYKMENIEEENLDILLDMTEEETTQIVVQEFLPEIYKGDFRILVINGKPFHKTLARIPQGESFKGNLAAGGKGVAMNINDNQRAIAEKVGEFLVSKGINFAGIDMIGSYLTEINITSPTCAREIFDQTGMNPIKEYFSKL
ncbi:MAG: glutathione synthase [Proteobacteria bacterium]|uniref:Glutathione synthetase n=1 Tax=SAR86 cluster bacterium TaxID=2030880 RepID=A0A937I9C1_9GAMM|nr:glutathione synthase [SAR86 cluster bacterium]MDA0775676.1 glutathione synthase [Pseudomonadota bacterium]MDA0976857.1 glutathione synthase [Pseudomonadota bacterium]MDA1037576.1 glutathione synthase [Pseudomonadota bacterium]